MTEDNGFYVAVEGIDGSGKTTAVEAIADELGVRTVVEPTEEWTGRAVREALQQETSVFTDMFLFMADRAEHLRREVLPALDDGVPVVSDRSAYSTYAYQTQRLEEHLTDPWSWLDVVHRPWDHEPDMVVYLDVSVETAMERLDGDEKYEKAQFLEAVKRDYSHLKPHTSARWVEVDAEQPEADMVDEVVSLVGAEL